MNGKVWLWRKSIDSAAFKNSNLWHVWTYCLLRATYQETKFLFNGEEIALKPGELITGRFEGAHDCNMKPSTFRDQLYKLQRMGNINIKSDNKKSLISICNWEAYQSGRKAPDTGPDSNPTTARHIQECNKEINIIYTEIFDYWNSKGIRTHRELTDKTISKIKAALKEYSPEEIKTAIDNYAFILKGTEYFFNYKWTLADFLSRGIENFRDLDVAMSNYRKNNHGKGLPPTQSDTNSNVRMLL